MTDEEIFRECCNEVSIDGKCVVWGADPNRIRTLLERVRAETQDKCADIADQHNSCEGVPYAVDVHGTAQEIAAAIRSLNEESEE